MQMRVGSSQGQRKVEPVGAGGIETGSDRHLAIAEKVLVRLQDVGERILNVRPEEAAALLRAVKKLVDQEQAFRTLSLYISMKSLRLSFPFQWILLLWRQHTSCKNIVLKIQFRQRLLTKDATLKYLLKTIIKNSKFPLLKVKQILVPLQTLLIC